MAHHPVWVAQYTRAHFGGEAVGCAPTPQHTTMSPRKRNTITTETGMHRKERISTENLMAIREEFRPEESEDDAEDRE